MEKHVLVDIYRQSQHLASLDAYKCTCHIFKINNDIPSPYGTGIFVRIGERYFVFTAAHVFEDSLSDIYIGMENNLFHRLGGECILNEIPKGEKRDKDRLDVGIMLLDKESVVEINKYYDFLDISEIELNHNLKPFPIYTAIGFPSSKSKLNTHKMTIKSKPFILHIEPCLNQFDYSELGCNSDTNLLFGYNKQRIYDYKKKQMQVGPDPFGMSGGGIWYVDPQNVGIGDNVSKKLIAIMTEWPIKNKKILMCTKIDIFIKAIKTYWG